VSVPKSCEAIFQIHLLCCTKKCAADTGKLGSTYDGGGGDASLIRDEGVALRRLPSDSRPPCAELPNVILLIDAARGLSVCGRV
jgi:hypothetical protein